MHAARDVPQHAGRRVFRGRLTIALTVCAAAAGLGAIAAWAQAPLPLANYGGGAISDPGKPIYGRGSMIISLRTTGTGKVHILAGMGARCGTATIKATATVGADGWFTVSGTAKENLGGGHRLRTKYTIMGSIVGVGAAGNASAKSTEKQTGRSTRTCKSGSVSWSAKQPPADIGTPGAAQPSTRLWGTTAQSIGKRRHGIVLRISADGKRVERALFTLNSRCGSDVDYLVDSPRKNLKIRADGTVSDLEQHSRTIDSRTRLLTTERFSATVGQLGATGSFKNTARVVSRRTGRTLLRCRSNKVKWTAAV